MTVGDPQVLIAVGAVASPILVFLGAWATTRIANKTTRDANREASAIDLVKELRGELAELRGRQDNVESELAAVQRVTRAAVNFIDRLGLWISGGMRGKVPTPPASLREHVDMALWADANGTPSTAARAPDDAQPTDLTRPSPPPP